MSRLLRAIACLMAVAALASVVLVVVLESVAGAPFLLGVGAPACVGLFLVLRRPRTLVAWILLAGALSVGVVMAA